MAATSVVLTGVKHRVQIKVSDDPFGIGPWFEVWVLDATMDKKSRFFKGLNAYRGKDFTRAISAARAYVPFNDIPKKLKKYADPTP